MAVPLLFDRGRRISGRTASLACAVILSAALPPAARAQPPQNQTETRSGTLVEIKKQGRGRFLVFEGADGEQQEFPLTPKVDFVVTAPGDAAAIAPGNFLTGTGTLTNNKLFLSDVSVRLAQKGKKLPPGNIVKAPAVVGESEMSYVISGVIVAAAPDTENAGYHLVALRLPGKIPPILLEPGFSVSVSSADPELAKAGAPVELEVAPLRGGRFNLLKATVKLDEPIAAAEAEAEKSPD